MRRRDKYLLILAIVAAVLIAVRAALPFLVRDYVNDKLQALDSYDGSVDKIHLALWRGAYRIEGIRIEKTGAKQPVPFFSSDAVDCSVEWRSLLRGSLVAEAVFTRPNVNLVQAKNEQQSQLGEGENWADRFEELFPFRFNTVTVRDGTVTFRAPGIRTEDAIKATALNGELSNLTNVVDSSKETFAQFRAGAKVLDNGSAQVNGSVDPLAPKPTFDVNLQVRNVELQKVNPWLRQYIKADAESGDFELYLEMAAADGKFEGYAKPILRNVNIYSSEEPEKNPLKRLWEGIVDVAAKIVENKQKEQVAARIPFRGTIENPKASILETIVSVLRNGFVGAFARSLEGSISVRAVRENLKDVGPQSTKGKDEKDKKKDEKKEDRKNTAPPDFGPKNNTPPTSRSVVSEPSERTYVALLD
jgi:hypothetical protein